MSTKKQNVVKRPSRTITKPTEKSKIKTEDELLKTKKDKQEKYTPKADSEKIIRTSSNVNKTKNSSMKTITSSSSRSTTSSVVSSRDTSRTRTETNRTSKSQSTLGNNAKRPSTPTSSRVTKTQFFPSKQIFSNAIRSSLSEESAKIREKTKTRNSNRSEEESLKIKKQEEELLKKRGKNKKRDEESLKHRERNESTVSSSREEEPQKNKVKKTLTLTEEEARKRERNKQNFGGKEPSEIRERRKREFTTVKEALPKNASSARILDHSEDEQSRNRERNKTRVLSPSEVKVLKPAIETIPREDNTQRPRTATLKKDKQEPEENSYEDDFDSYESDFEAYTSSAASSVTSNSSSSDTPSNSESESSVTSPRQYTESDEDRKLDSGNYDLSEYKHRQVLDNIKESIEQENAMIEQNRSNLASLSDEGFEEGKSLEKGSSQFINFLDAQKKHQHLKSLEKKRKRGEEILNMIRLDNQAFTLLEMPAVPYEVFIKKYGNNNTIQSATQTRDDDVTEETQTDLIENGNKWTQFPVGITKYNEADPKFMTNYKMECLGVGTDLSAEPNNSLDFAVNYDENKLSKSLSSSANTVLTLLVERSRKICKDIEINSGNVPFSDGYMSLNTNLPLTQNLAVNFATFSASSLQLITVHTPNVPQDHLKSIVGIWKVSNPNEPDLLLTTYGHVCCCCFGDNANLIYAGLSDGTIAVWDLAEDSAFVNFDENHLKLTSFITNISSGHTSKVVSVEATTFNTDDSLRSNIVHESFNSQVYSLDEEGTLIIWSLIILQQSHQRTISLVSNSRISLKQEYPNLANLQCTCMSINPLDTNHVFISTSYGLILHFIASGVKPIPKKYAPGTYSEANCLASCPFSPFYFLSGYKNGNINLYCRNAEKPLMIMRNGEESCNESGIEFLQWAYNKPCVFYTKDTRNNIHIWDLTISDIFPTYTIPFKEKISFMVLSPGTAKDNSTTRSHLLIVTEKNAVKLHILNKEHGHQSRGEYEENTKKFLNYVNRL